MQIDGQRRSKVLPTRVEAKEWAARAEYEIRNGAKIAAAQPFGDVMLRYAKEVSPTKRGERWEVVRIEKLRRDKIAKVPIAVLAAPDFNDWRVRRMREVSAASVRREMGLMSAVLTVARKDWGLISSNPITDVTKPPEPPARDRLVTDDELKRLAVAAGENLSLVLARAHHAFLFACETGMRAGEIVGLTWERVDLAKSVARLPMTKNGTARDVPLSKEAVRLLQALPKDDPVFGLSSQQLDSMFRKLRGMAAIDGLTFHDSRHTAVTRLARKVDVLTLAKIIGHKNISQLLTYYNETAADIAARLD